ncbi:hypothetical protein ACJX0J_033698, partial [Zea mays]
SLTISGILAQIPLLPAGRFMVAVLPDREEHVIITIFTNCGVSYGGGDAYSIGAITVMKAYYKQTLSFAGALLIVLTTQKLCYVAADYEIELSCPHAQASGMATGEEHVAASAIEDTSEKKQASTTELPAPSGVTKK